MDSVFGFIGCGNMGGALAKAARKQLDGAHILLANRTPEKARSLAGELGAETASNAQAARADYLFIGVKPQQQVQQPSAAEALMSTLLGVKPQAQPVQQTSTAENLLGALLGQQPKPQAQPTGLNGLLGTLMTANQPVQQQASSFDGSDLLNILAQMMLNK